MLTKEFYAILEGELNALIGKYKEDSAIRKHKAASHNQKSYALLIWFLEFYGRTSNYADYITDGDNDSSCDIVLNKTNSLGKEVFYIVQSKWNNENNAEKETDKGEILKALQDFETILRGGKKVVNSKLQTKLTELDAHLKANGEVKFIFLSLSMYKGQANENIQAFLKANPKTQFEVVDINRIKVDYIDREYKQIQPLNPLESYPNPEETEIDLEIVQDGGSIKIHKPYEAYVFLLRPKTIWQLFTRYNFSLFFKNVRNPLLQSRFNKDIERTTLEESSLFWYYNNGITAISKLLPDGVRPNAEKIRITGLQIINGAQTVYSIYRAYENATQTQRLKMDKEALITLRLLESGGKTFDLNVTRYTNAQNPVEDRDLCANDDIQIALQNASYQTKVWYEKRRGEFREVPQGITVVSNEEFAPAYLAYQLQDPVSAAKNDKLFSQTQRDLNFISHTEHKDGLYERIFNEQTQFEDMLCAYRLYSSCVQLLHPLSADMRIDFTYLILALSKPVFAKYFRAKYGENIQINTQILRLYELEDKNTVRKVYTYTYLFLDNFLYSKGDLKQADILLHRTFSNLYDYQKLCEALEETDFKVEDIEGIDLSETMEFPR